MVFPMIIKLISIHKIGGVPLHMNVRCIWERADSINLATTNFFFIPRSVLNDCMHIFKAKPYASNFRNKLSRIESFFDSSARYLPACLRGVLVERGAAKPEPRSLRSARPASTLSSLHPDSQRPPSLPPPWIGGLGSVAPFRSMLAKDGSNL